MPSASRARSPAAPQLPDLTCALVHSSFLSARASCCRPPAPAAPRAAPPPRWDSVSLQHPHKAGPASAGLSPSAGVALPGPSNVRTDPSSPDPLLPVCAKRRNSASFTPPAPGESPGRTRSPAVSFPPHFRPYLPSLESSMKSMCRVRNTPSHNFPLFTFPQLLSNFQITANKTR